MAKRYDIIMNGRYILLFDFLDNQDEYVKHWSPFINKKVEGGGIIFFDWYFGFRGAFKASANSYPSVSPDTTSDLGEYYIEDNIVKCKRLGTKHRFMVVAEEDLSTSIKWDDSSSSTYNTSQATSTDFGTGKANTTLLCNNIANDLWATVKTARETNPEGHTLVSDDSGLDTRWFIPSEDELYILIAMQYSNSSYRPSGMDRLSINYESGTLGSRYWSSSQTASYSYGALFGDFGNGYVSSLDKRNYFCARLCRTF